MYYQIIIGTIGGRVVASDADTWLKKASSLLSGNRKYSRNALNEHIRSSSSCKINPSCEELQSLKGMVLEADLWKTQRDELFEKAVRENVLLDNKECIDLLNSSPVGVRIEEWVHLDSLVKNVLRIEKVIRSLEGVTSVVVENSNVDEVKGLLNTTEELNLLDKGKDEGKVESKGKGCGVSIMGVESSSSSSSVDHLACGLRTEKELVNGHIDACTDLDSVTRQSFQSVEELSFVGMNAGQQSSSASTSASSLLKDMIEDVISDVISTDLNPFRSQDIIVSDKETSSSISSLADLKCDMHDSVANIDMKVEGEKKMIVDNKTSSNKADTRIHSVPSPQLKSIHWDEFVTLLKDVASVLPVRCDKCEVLLEMYSNVNAWVKEHIGGLLHHSPNSRLHSTTTTTASSSSSSSTASASSSFASSSALSSSSSSSFSYSSSSSSAITTTTSAVVNGNLQISKDNQTCIKLNNNTLDVNKMNPLAAILSKISSVYRSKTLDLTLFIAEDFLQFRVGLYMERQDALRGEGRSNEIAESRKNMTLPTLPVPVSCTVATTQQLSENGKKESDMICFCMMPSPMGESPILSQCDTCDRWYHPNCTNALLVSRTASQCAETFECPLCAHKKGKPSTIAYKPLSEWKLSIHSGIRMKGKGGGVNEIPEVSASTKNDSDHLSNRSNAKQCDMKQVQKKVKKERADPLGNSLRKKSKKQLPSSDISIPVIKSDCLLVNKQEDPLGPNITQALPDHGSPGASSNPLSYTVSIQNTSSSTAEVSGAMSSHNCNRKCSMLSLPALKADVTAVTTISTYPTNTIPENQSTPDIIIKTVVDPVLPVGSILTESIVPKEPIKSTLKKVKVPLVKPSNDPMTVTDIKCAMLSEKKMRFQKVSVF